MWNKLAEGAALELYHGLLDDRLVAPRAPLHIHELHERGAAHKLGGGCGREVGDASDEAYMAKHKQRAGSEPERVAVVGVEVGGHATAALVAKEVRLAAKLARELVLMAVVRELIVHHGDEHLLSLDLGHLHVAMRVTLQEQLVLDGGRQRGEERARWQRKPCSPGAAERVVGLRCKQVI